MDRFFYTLQRIINLPLNGKKQNPLTHTIRIIHRDEIDRDKNSGISVVRSTR